MSALCPRKSAAPCPHHVRAKFLRHVPAQTGRAQGPHRARRNGRRSVRANTPRHVSVLNDKILNGDAVAANVSSGERPHHVRRNICAKCPRQVPAQCGRANGRHHVRRNGRRGARATSAGVSAQNGRAECPLKWAAPFSTMNGKTSARDGRATSAQHGRAEGPHHVRRVSALHSRTTSAQIGRGTPAQCSEKSLHHVCAMAARKGREIFVSRLQKSLQDARATPSERSVSRPGMT